ncbi:PH domain-containing protein [Plantactinospora sp. S1510]|uniref:PH domain-containing protein n=1 Tax=Plantactinospora alkalitolerans TaxID=2789879 RepID=A0ABS0GZW5_9ACTN|nr:PH domain-containing protein [Plantactinospora alkalitolerans]MBF9131715.1 PH domain-containing protein [Plantactinospora alkalitolerans]
MHPDPDNPPLRWRVNRALPVLKLTGAVLFVALGAAFADGDPVRLGIASLAALGLLGWAVRDLVAPVRLAADAGGITVPRGFAGRRHIPWTEVEQISVDSRPRLGLRTETLEIDTGASIHLLSQYDLGVPPTDVAAALQTARPTRPTGRPGDPSH